MRPSAALAFAALAVACGSKYGASADDAGSPVTTGVDGGSDAAAPPPADCLGKPFTNKAFYPTPINESGISQYSGWLSPDSQTFLVCKDHNTGQKDLFVSTRANPAAAWGDLLSLDVDTASDECDGFFSADQTTLYFVSNRSGGAGQKDIYVASRAAGGAFGAATPLADVNSPQDEFTPWVAGDTLYFQSNRGGVDKIWYAQRSAQTGGFTAPVEVPGINTGGGNGKPVLSDDQLTIYFSRQSPGGSSDVFMARRASLNDAFGQVSEVAELSTTADDYPTWTSADGCRIIVRTYSRPNESTSQLFYAERR